MLKVINLHVKVGNNEILKGVNLNIGEGEIHALLGPNFSGKTTLAYAIMGIQGYKVIKGKILFKGKDITKLKVHKRARLGIALAFQHPPDVKGVKLKKILEIIGGEKVDVKRFGLKEELLEREVNVGFSGGEKKLSEIIQLLAMKPKLAIFDEIDSGLDLEKSGMIMKIIKRKFLGEGSSVLLITHNASLLKFINPDLTHLLVRGKIICSRRSWKKVLNNIKRYGYERCEKCELLSS
ncbi:MAG: ABC transporter ATP-binding protein [Candidatus Aenigmatarchaeota archaeon]